MRRRRRRWLSVVVLASFTLAAVAMLVLPAGPHDTTVPDAEAGVGQLRVLGAMTFAASSAGLVLIRLWRAQVRREAARAQLLGLVHPSMRRSVRATASRVS